MTHMADLLDGHQTTRKRGLEHRRAERGVAASCEANWFAGQHRETRSNLLERGNRRKH